jgi:hypothetical protein
MADDLFVIVRQTFNSVLFNVLNSRVVTIFFHRSPGIDNGQDRAIQNLNWQVRAQGFVIQNGVTGNDGRVDMIVRGASSTLELLHNGNPVAQYQVGVSTAALDAVTTVSGQKQRLRLLGYQLGHGGPDGNGVDANANVMEFERSVLDLQGEHSLTTNAVTDTNTRTALTNDAGT